MAGQERSAGATVFACHANGAQRYRVIQFGLDGKALVDWRKATGAGIG
jgi:hypothetical protein